ncbi:hypothetical protein [Streptomyces sp. NBC_01198]|uniref:hypothetical protein n=1 Tax=Streptomyces sp. NBC_01198 TaxID=2903769 RepID=UPI002E0FBF29|nr:hypothetical protein OG702_13470 [Streptomyces sp. NBC_01198]
MVTKEQRRRSPRVITRGLAVAVAVGLVWAAGTAPASAADGLRLYSQADLTLPLGPAGGENPVKSLSVQLAHQILDRTAPGTLTFDATTLAGVAEVTWPDACTPSADRKHAECDAAGVKGTEHDTVVLRIKAAPGAAGGAKGTVRYTGSSPGLPDVSGQTTVTVGAVADVFMHGLPEKVAAKPGDLVPLSFALTNRGGQPGAGSILTAHASGGLDSLSHYGNCAYGYVDSPDRRWVGMLSCVLPPVAPGTTVSYTDGVPFRVHASGLIEDVEISLVDYTPEALADSRRGSTLVQGDGPDMVPHTGGTTAQDWQTGYSWADPKINVDNTADFALSVAPVKGPKGATVTAAVELADRGPARYVDSWNERPAAQVEFDPPPGTTVVGANEDCLGYDKHGKLLDYNVPGVHYVCTQGWFFLPGQSVTDFFKLRIDKVIPNATGRAFLTPGYATPYDRNPANDTAKVVVNAKAAGGTSNGGTGGGTGTSGAAGGAGTAAGGAGGSPTAGPATGGTGSAGGAGASPDGRLAATGSDHVALVGGIAMGCGLLGGAVLLLLRSRRRTAA